MDTWDVVVVGGGAAGLSAAQMLGRARRRVVVVDAGRPRNRFAGHMHGVLGNDGVAPADLLARGRDEVRRYGVEVRTGVVARVDPAPGDHPDAGVEVILEDGSVVTARELIVATGMTDRLPDIPGLAERWGTGVLHCPYCHGWEVRDQRLGVLTTSPVGVHQAQLVRQWSDDVVVFTAGLGAIARAVAGRLRSRGIEVVDVPVVEVLGKGAAVTGARTADGAVVTLDALFTTSTADPHDGFLDHLGLDRTETATVRVLAVRAGGRTSAAHIWAVGNVVNPAATVPVAMGDGAATGSAVNMALVLADFHAAGAHPHPARIPDR
ncbi:oxidoreductase [Tersicoccus solisilvae]|uniref:Oxidoreductase n=1 Tax=Tersicoccus solisilvae TaxID=1882339 RepID=A0ABQ1PG72_9MICC|nr:NAD(P)/FAD-dependent oxidoreductase [Tersicoccus solisilvae]GGC96527.1 oxidoreductase [Tersicoccus solisilvae]